jgi:hypothetical protein
MRLQCFLACFLYSNRAMPVGFCFFYEMSGTVSIVLRGTQAAGVAIETMQEATDFSFLYFT